MQDIDSDRLVKIYVAIREARRQAQVAWETQDNDLKEQLDLVGNTLNELCKTLNADSIKTQHGVAYRVIRKRFWAADWSGFKEWLKKRDALALLENRIHQSNMAEYLKEHPEDQPPGLNIDSRYDIVVRTK